MTLRDTILALVVILKTWSLFFPLEYLHTLIAAITLEAELCFKLCVSVDMERRPDTVLRMFSITVSSLNADGASAHSLSSSFAQYNMDQFTPAKLDGYDEPVPSSLPVFSFPKDISPGQAF